MPVQGILDYRPAAQPVIYSLTPPIAAVISWLWLSDTLLVRHWLGMAVTLAGVVWVVLEEPEEDAGGGLPQETDYPDSRSVNTGPSSNPRSKVGLGLTLAVLAAVGQAVGMVLSKEGIGDYDAVGATFIRVLGGMVGYLALVTLGGRWQAMFTASRNRQAMLVVTLGAIVGPFLGVVLNMVALRDCPAGIVATIISTMPILILPFSITLHGEKISLRAAGGAALSVVGVALLAV
jgi:drug/metabolite transporter (DMT)-like permease